MQINLFAKQKLTHRHRKQMYGFHRGEEGGINYESGVERHITIYFHIYKDLLYITGNYIHYIVITYNEK